MCDPSVCPCPSSRLCGNVPFYDTSVSKLNELIRAGKLEFSEPQWASISDEGTLLCILPVCVCVRACVRVCGKGLEDLCW